MDRDSKERETVYRRTLEYYGQTSTVKWCTLKKADGPSATYCGTRGLFSSYHRKTSSRDRLRHRRATTIRSIPICRYGDDNIGAETERIIKVKVAPRRRGGGLRDIIDAHAHALYIRRCSLRDCLLHGTGVEPFDRYGRTCVEVPVVHCIFGYHW